MSVGFRRRVSLIACLSVASLVGGLLAPATAIGSTQDAPAPIDRLVREATGRTSALVHVEKQASVRDGLTAATGAGLDIGTRYDAIKVFVAYGKADNFRRLAAEPAIEFIQANSKIELFTETSHIATRGQNLLDGEVMLPEDTKIDGRGVGVAVIDSGVDGTHPDLVDRMGGNVKMVCTAPLVVTNPTLGGFQECRGPKAAVPMDDTDHPSGGGHGTHVAGTVAGTGLASSGRWHGAAPGATLYGVSVGTTLVVENGLDGLAWVLENHDKVAPAIKVVNNSWGSGYRKYSADGDLLYDATWKLQEALIDAGVTVVFAAGNSGGNGSTPTTGAQCVNPTPGLVCVANYDDKNSGTRAGTIDGTSSRGSTTDPESWPDISAPGTTIIATCRLTLPVCNAHAGAVMDPPNLYSTLSGTSMAAPHVAGIIAQMYQVDPTLTPAAIENILEDTAHKFAWGSQYGLITDPTNPDDTSSFEKGHGLVDALAAVQAVQNGGTEPDPTPTETTEPTPTGPGTRYYFHSNDVVGNVGGTTFDTELPEWEAHSYAFDPPLVRNGAPNAVWDPYWSGTIDEKITKFTLDFWAKTPAGDLLGEVNYSPTIWVGSTAYELPTLTQAIDPQIGDVPSRLTKTYTTMLDANDAEVPLSIDPAGQEVTISIAGRYVDEEAGSWIAYDSIEQPSGFVVNGTGSTDPDPTPTETTDPDPDPTDPGTSTRGTYPANPNDPLFADQWGMTKIKAPQAWQETNATGFGIKIAVVDSGLDIGHEDFACPGKVNLLPGSDFIEGDGRPQDGDGHGTHVAGIATACTNNGKGVVGVAPDASIMPVRWDGTVLNPPALDAAMAEGIRFATENGAHVINLSIGDIPPFSHTGSFGYPETDAAMAEAREAGVVIAAAAGNFDQPACEYPSMSRNVICVIATDRDDMRAYYTDFPVNLDPNSEEPGIEPVVAAPGGHGTFCEEAIVSTYLRSEDSVCYSAGYEGLDGTSMAAPHVAGLAALLYDRIGGQRSGENADLIVQTILDSAEDLYTPGWDPIVGYGRIDALAAIQALPEPEVTPTEEPTESDTTVAFTDNSAESGTHSDDARFEAVLTDDSTGLPVEEAELVFELTGADATRTFTAVTDVTGTAGDSISIDLKPDTYVLTVRYAGEADRYNGAAETTTFVVDKEATEASLSSSGNAANRTLTATLVDHDDSETGIADRELTFSADGTELGTARTDANGVATFEVPRRYAGGPRQYTVSFAGDDFYNGSSASTE